MKTAKLTKTKGRYVGLTDAILAQLPDSAPAIERRLGLPRRRAATILLRLSYQHPPRVVLLGSRLGPTSQAEKVWGRPEHLKPPQRKRGPR